MLNWFRSTTGSAGFTAQQSIWLCSAILAAASFVGAILYQPTHILAFALSGSILTLAFCLDYLTIRARMRRRQIAQAWPEVLDSLVSASTSGFSVFDSLMELATSGPASIRPYFKQLEKDVESGLELNVSLERMRDSMADLNVDRLVELVGVVSVAGGQGFYLALRNQAKQAREDLALRGELESKQGWVSGTAKVAILAPWLVVGMLCARQENIAAYSSYQGSTILIIGLIVSIFAYRLVQLLGSTSQPQRVFIK